MRRALIVSGGTMDCDFGRNYTERYGFDYKIAVDFGLQFFYDAELMPDMIVGDFDSADEETLHYFEAQKKIAWMRLNPMKDDTDTEAALKHAVAQGAEEIHILGGTGNRLDHLLGNIGLLGMGFETDTKIFLTDPKNRLQMIQKDLKLLKTEQYGTYVSLLPVTPEVTGITLTGMKYPLKDYTMKCYRTIGISNEILEDEAWIRLKNGTLLVMESKD